MGFFNDLKQDLSSAVNELLPEDSLEAEYNAEQEKAGAAVDAVSVPENIADLFAAENTAAEADVSTVDDILRGLGESAADAAPAEEPVQEEPLQTESVTGGFDFTGELTMEALDAMIAAADDTPAAAEIPVEAAEIPAEAIPEIPAEAAEIPTEAIPEMPTEATEIPAEAIPEMPAEAAEIPAEAIPEMQTEATEIPTAAEPDMTDVPWRQAELFEDGLMQTESAPKEPQVSAAEAAAQELGVDLDAMLNRIDGIALPEEAAADVSADIPVPEEIPAEEAVVDAGIDMTALAGAADAGIDMTAFEGAADTGIDMTALEGAADAGLDMSALTAEAPAEIPAQEEISAEIPAVEAAADAGLDMTALAGATDAGIDMTALAGAAEAPTEAELLAAEALAAVTGETPAEPSPDRGTDLFSAQAAGADMTTEAAMAAVDSLAETAPVSEEAPVAQEAVTEETVTVPDVTEDLAASIEAATLAAVAAQDEAETANNTDIQTEAQETKRGDFFIMGTEVLDETATITAGMAISGDIQAGGNLEFVGVIHGNIEILGKLDVTGTIEGNSKAAEIVANDAKIIGDVVSEGSLQVGQGTVIIGNVSATSATIAGAIKGDIDVHGPVVLDTSAIVMGNIKSKSVQINNGAVIEGMCSQCYADVNPTSFFDELKKGGR